MGRTVDLATIFWGAFLWFSCREIYQTLVPWESGHANFRTVKPFDRVRKVNGVSGMLGTFIVKRWDVFGPGDPWFFWVIRDPLFLWRLR